MDSLRAVLQALAWHPSLGNPALCVLYPRMCLQEKEENGSAGLSRSEILARLFPATADSQGGSSPLSRISPSEISGVPSATGEGLRATLGALGAQAALA